MSGRGVIQASPVGVPGTYGGIDARGALFGNVLPGLFQSGDFAVSQRGAGANMSVDVAQGQAIVTPSNATHQNAYLIRRTNGTAWNTSSDGSITWTAADPSNPRIDLVCLEVRDTDMDSAGVYQGNIRIVDGTATVNATHQLEFGSWPAIPTGLVPIAAVRVPAAATSLTTTNITNLNPSGGGRAYSQGPNGASGETTTSATFARLATPDFAFVYVPSASSRVRVEYTAHWKISVAGGTQSLALYVDGTQLNGSAERGSAGGNSLGVTSLGTLYSRVITGPGVVSAGLLSPFYSIAGSGSDATDSLPQQLGASVTVATPGAIAQGAPMTIMGMSQGWHMIEMRYKTTANTLTARNRYMWAEVV